VCACEMVGAAVRHGRRVEGTEGENQHSPLLIAPRPVYRDRSHCGARRVATPELMMKG